MSAALDQEPPENAVGGCCTGVWVTPVTPVEPVVLGATVVGVVAGVLAPALELEPFEDELEPELAEVEPVDDDAEPEDEFELVLP